MMNRNLILIAIAGLVLVAGAAAAVLLDWSGKPGWMAKPGSSRTLKLADDNRGVPQAFRAIRCVAEPEGTVVYRGSILYQTKLQENLLMRRVAGKPVRLALPNTARDPDQYSEHCDPLPQAPGGDWFDGWTHADAPGLPMILNFNGQNVRGYPRGSAPKIIAGNPLPTAESVLVVLHNEDPRSVSKLLINWAQARGLMAADRGQPTPDILAARQAYLSRGQFVDQGGMRYYLGNATTLAMLDHKYLPAGSGQAIECRAESKLCHLMFDLPLGFVVEVWFHQNHLAASGLLRAQLTGMLNPLFLVRDRTDMGNVRSR